MPTDVYVKFGESNGTGGPNNSPLPAIEGDSDDANHYWWCELRDCGFNMQAPEQGEDEGESGGNGKGSAGQKKEIPTFFKEVTLRKRVDWASTQLFQMCCDAAEAESKKSENDKKGVIDQVTVHVCRPAGGEKIPFLIIKYYGVRVTHFRVGMNGPESSEEITFKFEALEYEYQRTSPYTGATQGDSVSTDRLKNHPHEKEKSKKSEHPAAGATPPGSSASPAILPAPVASPAHAPANGSQSLHSPTDERARRHIPGRGMTLPGARNH